ncbi:LytR/AlgR family response regulator transcription factor [Kangiella sp.]|uniref:LytR/AlgR family response regulator transcription factor n=1 Tax=Kangiella sp. TaxID=1920245 RepID=UPI003A91B1EA
MINSIKQAFKFLKENRTIGVLLFTLIAIVSVAIFQDYLHSSRNGYPFFFSESLLFKAFWIFFPPLLLLLKNAHRKGFLNSFPKRGGAVAIATLVHLSLVPLTIWSLSAIFREQSYGIFKVLTYTMANDFVKILLIYGAFVLWLKHSETKRHKDDTDNQPSENEVAAQSLSSPQYLTVSSGKNNTRIKLSDVLYIKAATPYVAIQLADKQYLHSESLKSIGEKLDARFIRVHRSSIVNIDKVVSYQSRLNGDYDLRLQDETEIRLSRNYVSQFKHHFQSNPQVTL